MLVSAGNYQFEGVTEKISKKGNPFRLVEIIDKDNYQRLEFFADDQLEVKVGEHSPCCFILKPLKTGYSTSMNCVAVNPPVAKNG